MTSYEQVLLLDFFSYFLLGTLNPVICFRIHYLFFSLLRQNFWLLEWNRMPGNRWSGINRRIRKGRRDATGIGHLKKISNIDNYCI